MAIILEVINRSGQVVQGQLFDNHSVTVGRSYNNDFTIIDDYIDPEHIEISVEGEYFSCKDRLSKNGVSYEKQTQSDGENILRSGDLIYIGKTILRVTSLNTACSPAKVILNRVGLYQYLSRQWFALLLVLLLVTLHIIDVNISFPILEDKSGHYIEVLYILLSAAIYAAIFYFIGRRYHHDNAFLFYFSMALTTFIAVMVYDWISPFVLFNVGLAQNEKVISTLVYACIVGFLVSQSIRCSTNLRFLPRALIASIFPGFMLIALISTVFKHNDHIAYPRYDTLVFHYSMYFGSIKKPKNFVELTDTLYSPSQDDGEY